MTALTAEGVPHPDPMLPLTRPYQPTTPLPPPTPAPRPAASMRAGTSSLAPGTRLGEFEIVRLLGTGGFGIVYLAHDRQLLRQVAIKEYMPASIAGRRPGTAALVHHESAATAFAAGLASFLNEAQLLARFDHPALVKVYRFWQANNTAYMAMPYYDGRTLKDARRDMPAVPDDPWLRSLVEPLLSAVELLHGEGIFHRDISPDNVMILRDGRPVLLDFGSARRAIGHRNGAMTVLVKPNFAPIEQYGDDSSLRQGPWTDLYALGATLRFALTGEAPTPSVVRAVRDDLAPLAAAMHPALRRVSLALRTTIDSAMALSPEDRPQDVASFRRQLRGESPARGLAGAGKAAAPGGPSWRLSRSIVAGAIGALALAAAAAAGWLVTREEAAAPPAMPALTQAETQTPVPTQMPKQLPAQSQTQGPATTATPASPPAPAPTLMWRASHIAAAATESDVPVPAGPATTSRRIARSAGSTKATTAPAPARAPARIAAPPGPAARLAAPARSTFEMCSGLGFLSRQLCVARECRKAELQAQPQCVARRRSDEERERRAQQ